MSFYQMIGLCIVLGQIFTTGCSPTVESSSVADKSRYLLAGLEKLKDEISKNDWISTQNLYMLSPEELMFLEYRDLLERAKRSYCSTNWPNFFLFKPDSSTQNKVKKNSEMSRGMYNALNHLDMFNAGK